MFSSEEALQEIENAVEYVDFADLSKVIRLVEREQKRREKEARKQAQLEMKQVAQKYGLELEEIISGSPRSVGGGTRGKVPAKYRHPSDPETTWTGRGRKPKWIREWEDAGHSVEELRITS